MDEKTLTFNDAPYGYALCFNSDCALHDKCMHYHIGQLAPAEKTHGVAIYPSAWKSGQCCHFAKKEKVEFAWGFNGLYTNMSHDMRTAARMALRAHLGGGASAYYRIHNGEKLLSPARQQEILNYMARFGDKDSLRFDHYVTQYDFTT
jgi:hypothetical protein